MLWHPLLYQNSIVEFESGVLTRSLVIIIIIIIIVIIQIYHPNETHIRMF